MTPGAAAPGAGCPAFAAHKHSTAIPISEWPRRLGTRYQSRITPQSRVRRFPRIEQIQEPFGSYKPIAVSKKLSHINPLDRAVKPNSDPPARPHIRRYEEACGRGPHHPRLVSRRGLDPDGVAATPVAVGTRVHGEHLVPYSERRLAPGLHLVRFRECQTQLSQSGNRAWWHVNDPRTAPCLSSSLVAGQAVSRRGFFERPSLAQ